MKKLSVLILTSILLFSSLSCGDDDGGDVEATLTGGKWQLVRLSFNGEDVTATDLDACDLLDTYEFREDNTFVFVGNSAVDGTEACDSQTSSGIWREDTSVPNSLRFVAAFDGEDINVAEEQINFRIEDKTLREIVQEPNADGCCNNFNYFYEKQ